MIMKRAEIKLHIKSFDRLFFQDHGKGGLQLLIIFPSAEVFCNQLGIIKMTNGAYERLAKKLLLKRYPIGFFIELKAVVLCLGKISGVFINIPVIYGGVVFRNG